MPPSASIVAAVATSTSAGLAMSVHTVCTDVPGDVAPSARAAAVAATSVASRIPQRHRGARCQEPLGHGPADALRAAGDDGAAAGEVDCVHGVCLGACGAFTF